MAFDVIDNEDDNNLADRLGQILPKCERIDALVGYFYFSGFDQIWRQVEDKKIRILVGLEADPTVLSHVVARRSE